MSEEEEEETIEEEEEEEEEEVDIEEIITKPTPSRRGRKPKKAPVEKPKAPIVEKKPEVSTEEVKENIEKEIVKAQKEIEKKTKEIMKLEKAKGVPNDLKDCIMKIKTYQKKCDKLNEEYIPQNSQKYAVKLEYQRLLKVHQQKRDMLILKYGRARAT